MSTPEPSSVLTAESNAPNISSTAETVLAEANAIVNGDTTYSAPERAPTPDAGEADDPAQSVAPDAPEKKTRSLSWNDAIKQVPPDIAKLMKQMQGDYTRKTQELSEQRRDFKRERQALMAGTKDLKEKEVPEYDPFNEQSINARIENEVSRRLREVLEPMEQEYKVMQAEDSYKSFLTEHPDFKDDQTLRSEVQHLLEGNSGLDLETAYWAAKGKQAKARKKTENVSRKAKREAQREAANAIAPSRRGKTGATAPRNARRNMSNADILALAKEMHRNG